MEVEFLRQIGERRHFYKKKIKADLLIEIPYCFSSSSLSVVTEGDCEIFFSLSTYDSLLDKTAIFKKMVKQNDIYIISFPISFLKVLAINDSIYSINVLC